MKRNPVKKLSGCVSVRDASTQQHLCVMFWMCDIGFASNLSFLSM